MTDGVVVTRCAPSIASVRGGTSVALIGNNFYNASRLMCVFGGVLVNSLFINSTAIVCKTPESILPGNVLVSLYFPGGKQLSTEMSLFFHGKSLFYL